MQMLHNNATDAHMLRYDFWPQKSNGITLSIFCVVAVTSQTCC